jgi:hypothetical protein
MTSKGQEKEDRKSKRSQNIQNIPGTRNLSRDGIEDMCFKASFSMHAKKITQHEYII